jgi:D-alanyl-D-alanine carboxypeptidase
MPDTLQDRTTSTDLLGHAERLRRRWMLPAIGLGRIGEDCLPEMAVAGFRARRRPEAVEPGDCWHIGSITKSMTALLLARFVARGVTHFDAPLSDLAALPLHPELGRQSLRALLAHRAGLAANPARDQFFVADLGAAEPQESVLRDGMLAPFVLTPPRPGKFCYSNLGYMLAGHIAEQLGGAPWRVLMQREIGAPLGLKSLGFGPPVWPNPLGHGSFLSTLVTLRGRGPAPFRPAAHSSPNADLSPAFGPSGLVNLSLRDLLRYGAAIAGLARGKDGLIPGAIFCDLISGQDYAGGWVTSAGGLSHEGSNGLWVADLRIDSSRHLVTAMVTNTGSLGALLAVRTSGWRRTASRGA